MNRAGVAESFREAIPHTDDGPETFSDWLAHEIERDTGVRVMTGREFFEQYGIPAAAHQEERE